jgi:hypothetical protein
MNWPSQNDAQFGSLVKPGKINPGGLSSRIPPWIYPLGFRMSLFFLPRIDWPIAIVAVSKAPPA